MLHRLFPSGLRALSVRRGVAAALCLLAVAVTVVALTLPRPAVGQVISPDLAAKILQQNGDDSQDDTGTTTPTVQTFQPVLPGGPPEPTSHLESIYQARSNQSLTQFGYDVLGAPRAVTITQTGAIPDRYVLGASDQLIISLRGQENATYRVRIDRDGNVTLPKLAPIPAAGRTFGDFRANLEEQIATAYISTKVFVALGTIHQISVLVSGEVRSPGVRIVSGLANPLDVILLSGGIKKSGSLRAVRVVNGDSSRVIDLYTVIAQGNSSGLGVLRDGDRVYVPPLGATVAVAGNAARPAIYELPPGATAISAGALLKLAGGPEVAGPFSLARFAIQRNGSLAMQPISAGAAIRSGEIMFVQVSRGALIGRITVLGSVAVPGARPLATNRTVSDIFRSAADLSLNGYAPFAIIRRRDPVTNAMVLVPFSITGAIRKTVDVPLQDEDTIFVFSRVEALALANTVAADLNTAYSPGAKSQTALPAGQTEPGTALGTGSAQPVVKTQDPDSQGPLAPAGSNSAGGQGGSIAAQIQAALGNRASDLDPRFASSASRSAGSEAASLATAQSEIDRSGGESKVFQEGALSNDELVGNLASTMGVSRDALTRIAFDNLAWVLDQVREPGAYLAARGTSIADLIQAAGGFQQTADLSEIEVTSTEVDQATGRTRTTRTGYNQGDGQMVVGSIRPLDVVRVRPVYSDRELGTVTVSGEVRYPGVFDITRDEKLSSLLQRAGGMTEVAYPYGAIFTRKEAALNEKEGNERSARELENQIPALMFTQNANSSEVTAAGGYLASLAASLRQMPALGRIVVTADPTVLATRPELDFVLQPGDTLYIPKRPSTVTVTGEVRNAGSFQYRAGLRYSEYLRLAGGTTQNADEGRTFIVMPDGSATPVDASWLSFGNGGNIPPGATIVVPRDLRPFLWSEFLKDTTQILSQLAVTAASIAVLRNN